jgi:predicted GNAT family N-acyltransferase
MSAPSLVLRLGSWAELGAEAGPIRFEVFVEEQKVPAEMELDEFDALSCHALALADGQPVGTGRLLPDGHIGRMAVLAGWRAGRRRGPAAGLIDEAGRRGMAQLALSAQTHALGFYARFGFVPEGEVYEEAGLPHQVMTRVGSGSPHR